MKRHEARQGGLALPGLLHQAITKIKLQNLTHTTFSVPDVLPITTLTDRSKKIARRLHQTAVLRRRPPTSSAHSRPRSDNGLRFTEQHCWCEHKSLSTWPKLGQFISYSTGLPYLS